MLLRTARHILALSLLGAMAAAQVAPAPPPYRPRSADDPARSQEEAIALAYMRTVVSAQRLYYKSRGRYAPSLAALVGQGSFTKRMTVADRGAYVVRYRALGERRGYALTLTPREVEPERRAFFVNESGIIRASEEEEEATADSDVLRPDPREPVHAEQRPTPER
jgi:hypothetical protein